MAKKTVPEVSIRRDMRFTLQENWNDVVQVIAECKERGVLVTPLTVFDDRGMIVGWFLHGWVSPPGIVLYPKPEETIKV
jgi:hypothetical protein